MSQEQFIENFLAATDFRNPVEATWIRCCSNCRSGIRWPPWG